MQHIRSHIIKLFTGFIAGAILISLSSHSAAATALLDEHHAPPESGLAPNPYNIGSPTLIELWVNPVTGRNSNNGLTPAAPLKTITAAWNKIPSAPLTTTGYRINLQPGTYPCEPAEPNNCQNNFGNRTGTYAFPIIIRAYNGPGTVTIRGGFDMANVSYLYLIDLTLRGGTPLPTNSSGNNLLHLASVDHILLRGLTLDGPDCDNDSCNNLQEVLKVNQAQYLYVENSVIGGAWHSAVDYFVVQYGHFINNNIHTAGQWCMYIKGGTSYLRIEGNEFHNCQLGFSAGQSGNFAMMRSPWLHYDAYDIKFINNILHDLPGVGLSVGGGYNILFAYNTLYRVGISTDNGYPLFDIIRGERGCNATDELPLPVPVCRAFTGSGGWGPNFYTENRPAIPNRNVYIYNNIIYNPTPSRTLYTHFNILEPLARPSGFVNMPNPILTDDNLQIRGNVIWNGDSSMPLGIEGTRACAAGNPTCNEAQLRADNAINTIKPTLGNPAGGDFHPNSGWISSVTTYAIPDFSWTDITPLSPSVPIGNNSNTVSTDFEGVARSTINPPGAYYRSAVPIVRTAPVLTAPANALLTNDRTPNFTWNAVSGGYTYQLDISKVPTSATRVQRFYGTPRVLSYTATALPNGVYYWRVRALNLNRVAGPWSTYRSFTVDATPPAAPVLRSPANAASVTRTPPFTWLASATAKRYQFQYDNDADFSSPLYTFALSTLTHTPPAMTSGTYSWHVRAKDAAGNWSAWSSPRTVTIAPLAPPAPISPATDDVSLNWSAMEGAVNYQIQLDNNRDFNSPEFDGTTETATHSLDTGLPDGIYYWRVRQTNQSGEISAWSEVWSITIQQMIPAAPTLLLPIDSSAAGAPTFSWESVENAVNYQIQVDDNEEFDSCEFDDTAGTTDRTPDAPLANGVYYWRVRAINAHGASGDWSPLQAVTINAP